MNALRAALILLAIAITGGCAHPMIIKPEMEGLAVAPNADRIAKNVGMYISASNREKEVTTPGGGGDKVTYRPYADIETGLYKILSDVFQNVEILQSAPNAGSPANASLAYVFEPEISTTSSSSGVLTWMATDFTVQLTCKVNDPNGQAVSTVSSVGSGHADFSELKSNFSLAGQRASQDALIKLRASLLQSAELRK
jgi:hypothetical protein